MAACKDVDTKRNIAGVMFRLAMCKEIKRKFVEHGVLKPLLNFSHAQDRDVKRYAMARRPPSPGSSQFLAVQCECLSLPQLCPGAPKLRRDTTNCDNRERFFTPPRL